MLPWQYPIPVSLLIIFRVLFTRKLLSEMRAERAIILATTFAREQLDNCLSELSDVTLLSIQNISLALLQAFYEKEFPKEAQAG